MLSPAMRLLILAASGIAGVNAYHISTVHESNLKCKGLPSVATFLSLNCVSELKCEPYDGFSQTSECKPSYKKEEFSELMGPMNYVVEEIYNSECTSVVMATAIRADDGCYPTAGGISSKRVLIDESTGSISIATFDKVGCKGDPKLREYKKEVINKDECDFFYKFFYYPGALRLGGSFSTAGSGSVALGEIPVNTNYIGIVKRTNDSNDDESNDEDSNDDDDDDDDSDSNSSSDTGKTSAPSPTPTSATTPAASGSSSTTNVGLTLSILLTLGLGY